MARDRASQLTRSAYGAHSNSSIPIARVWGARGANAPVLSFIFDTRAMLQPGDPVGCEVHHARFPRHGAILWTLVQGTTVDLAIWRGVDEERPGHRSACEVRLLPRIVADCLLEHGLRLRGNQFVPDALLVHQLCSQFLTQLACGLCTLLPLLPRLPLPFGIPTRLCQLGCRPKLVSFRLGHKMRQQKGGVAEARRYVCARV